MRFSEIPTGVFFSKVACVLQGMCWPKTLYSLSIGSSRFVGTTHMGKCEGSPECNECLLVVRPGHSREDGGDWSIRCRASGPQCGRFGPLPSAVPQPFP